MRLCSITGCGQKHYARNWCRRHYVRWWEGGTPFGTKPEPQERITNSNGYALLRRPGHPLATSPGGRGLEHRILMFDCIGPGAHPCGYCTTIVTWGVDLEIDHIDANPLNNDLSNLCVCCGPCNKRKANARRWGLRDLEASA